MFSSLTPLQNSDEAPLSPPCVLTHLEEDLMHLAYLMQDIFHRRMLYRKLLQNTRQGIYAGTQPGASEISFSVSGYPYILKSDHELKGKHEVNSSLFLASSGHSELISGLHGFIFS